MRLYYKHLLRCIRKRPTQPIFLALVLLLSILLVTIAFTLQDMTGEEVAHRRGATYGKADLVISLNASSDTRFLFPEDAAAALPEGSTVLGIYELPVRIGDRLAAAIAADIRAFDALLPLRIREAIPLTDTALREVVLLSAAAAAEMGASAGDAVTLTVLGQERTYTVGAVCAGGFCGEGDVLLPIGGITRALSATSPLLASLGDRFRPAGSLYVSLPEGVSEEEAIARLRAVPTFADQSLLSVDGYVESDSLFGTVGLITVTMVLIVAALSATVTYCAFCILGTERAAERESFLAAGASPRAMAIAEYAEVLLYWGLAAPVGLALSPFACLLLREVGSFRYASPTASAVSLAFGVLLPLLFATLAVTAHLAAGRRRTRRASLRWLPRVLPLLPLLAVAAVLIPGSSRFFLGICLFFAVLLLGFLVASPLFAAVAARLARRWEGRPRVSPSRLLAAKGVVALPLLRNAARLLALLLAMMLIAALVLGSVLAYFAMSRTLFTAELSVTGATERTAALCRETPGVTHVDEIYYAMGELAGERYLTLSASRAEVFDPRFLSSDLPQGDGAILSTEIAIRNGLSVGDTISLMLEGREYRLRVDAILTTAVQTIVFDAAHCGISPNLLLVTGDGGEIDDLRERLGIRTATEFVDVLPSADLLDLRMASMQVYVNVSLLLFGLSVLFSFVGILNTVRESYRERREDFALFAMAGMSSAAIARMKRHELCLLFLLAITFGLLLALLAIPVLQYAFSPLHNLVAYLL